MVLGESGRRRAVTNNPYIYVAGALLLLTHRVHLRHSASGVSSELRLPGAWSVLVWLFVYLAFAALLLSSRHGTEPVRGGVCFALLILALAIRSSAARALGDQYTEFISVPEEHRLVTDGVYSALVHPLHFGILLEHLALWLLMSGSGSAFRLGGATALLLASCATCLARNRQEEDYLRKRHGRVYDAYLRQVASTPIGGMLRRIGF